MSGVWVPIPAEGNRTPSQGLYLQELQRVQEAQGVQVVLGIPAEQCSQERCGQEEERQGRRQYPEMPASACPTLSLLHLEVMPPPASESRSHHDSHPHPSLLNFKEQSECVASEL